ncbi:hypothetical protein [Pedobacter polaris]|uniref:hypothetical protein n=1 Tax=Pedobacter polaris TaxID=2571273 RepID=UPI00197FFA88|nr:hypothetical protein [Pedobacter polaris]
MAILHHKEEKIQVVLGRLPKKYTHEQFVEMFIKLYSKDWGKIKAAYIKQSQDKEPGTVINMPKPDLYLKQILDTYIIANPPKAEEIKEKAVKVEKSPVTKAAPKKKVDLIVAEEPVKKPKVVAKKKTDAVDKVEMVKKPKAVSKKKVEIEETVEPTATAKKKVPAKKKIEEEKIAPAKVKKAKTTEK